MDKDSKKRRWDSGGSHKSSNSNRSDLSNMFRPSKVPSWKEEKRKLERMSLEEKRRYVGYKKFIACDEENFPGVSKLASRKSLKEKMHVWRGDITKLEIDVIVNAANKMLRGGIGVDGAIHDAAGKMLMKETDSRYPDGCPTGEAKMTCGYKLPAKYVIHTVGPRIKSERLLSSCYTKTLDLVTENNLRTVAFPCISTGVYGYPNHSATGTAIDTVSTWLKDHPDYDCVVIFCVFLELDEKLYNNFLDKLPDSDNAGTIATPDPPSSHIPTQPPAKPHTASAADDGSQHLSGDMPVSPEARDSKSKPQEEKSSSSDEG